MENESHVVWGLGTGYWGLGNRDSGIRDSRVGTVNEPTVNGARTNSERCTNPVNIFQLLFRNNATGVGVMGVNWHMVWITI